MLASNLKAEVGRKDVDSHSIEDKSLGAFEVRETSDPTLLDRDLVCMR